MEEPNKEIEEKQKFLVNEIMNQNYDPQRFSDYISELKENGTDLNNWTFEELEEIVISFKNQENSSSINNGENIEKEVENVRNSFIFSNNETEKNFELLNNNDKNLLDINNNANNSYNQIFDEKDKKDNNKEIFNSNKEEENKKNLTSEIGDFEIIDSSSFIDSSKDKLICIKQRENSLLKYNDLNVDITG